MASHAAPELQPDFPVRSQPLPQGSPIGGRELYKRAVRNFLRREIEKGNGHQHRLTRRSEAQWDRASDIKWKVLPSIIRRRWEAESRRLWPRRGDDPSVRVEPMDVFCNADEIYYVRGKMRPRKGQQLDWSEEYIRERYQPVYDALKGSSPSNADAAPGSPRSVATPSTPSSAGLALSGGAVQNPPPNPSNPADPDPDAELPLLSYGKNLFRDEAYKIDHARGWEPPPGTWLAGLPTYTGAHDNGPLTEQPSHTVERGDASTLHEAIGDPSSRGHWRWHKLLGQGTFGKAMLYRWADAQGNTRARVVVKRDLEQASDEERRIFRSLRDAGVDSRYMVKYLGESARKGSLGVTYLEFAPYGTLDELYKYYESRDIMLPEAFLWYLLRCLAEAAVALEAPVPPHKKAMFHYDIKPANILLNAADVSATSHHWHQNYPVVQLADFGGVCEYPDAGAPETVRRGGGTPHWEPWELLRTDDQVECNAFRTEDPGRHSDGFRLNPNTPAPKPPLPVDHPCRAHTTVWQIGLVLWCGMRLPPRAWPPAQLWSLPAYDENIYTSPAAYDAACHTHARTDFPPRHARRNRDDASLPITHTHALVKHFFPTAAAAAADEPPPPAPQTSAGAGRRPKKAATTKKKPKPPRNPNPTADPLLDAATLRAHAGSGARHDPSSYPPRTALHPQYSARLVEAAYRCLEPLPRDRPAPAQLLAEARDACRADLERWWPGAGSAGGVVAGAGVGVGAGVRRVVPGPGGWWYADGGDGGAGLGLGERVGVDRPRGVVLVEEKYPVGGQVLNDVYT